MEYAEGELKKNGIKVVEISIVAQFERLQRYYERMGYVLREKKMVPSLPFEVTYMVKEMV